MDSIVFISFDLGSIWLVTLIIPGQLGKWWHW